MRHQKAGRKFSRTSAHRKAMFSNMVASLILHERIETTEPKAKELKRIAEKTISWGTSVAELTAKGRDKLSPAEKAKVVHAMRMARRVVRSPEALSKLFGEVAPALSDRPGGYTRLLKTRVRQGDATQMSMVALVSALGPADDKNDKNEKDEKPAKGAKAKGDEPAAKKPRKSKKSEEANA